jgi:two-component system response regulator
MQQSERSGRAITILMADDDEDDRELTRDALRQARYIAGMQFVVDGQDLLDYLRRDGAYASLPADAAPRPSIILLDLNMPRMDGREALAEIKRDGDLRQIPVVVLTTSSDELDVRRAYDLGANSYITKPVTHAKLHAVLSSLAEYWTEVVRLPDSALG